MLAIHGGKPVRDSGKAWPMWPVGGNKEKQFLSEVVDSSIWTNNGYNGPKEVEFIEHWKNYINVKHAFLVANGTVSIQLALEALNIGWGDEVIVPGLTWQATAAAVLDVNAVPILVDIEPDTWCIDPKAVEAAITPRTKAIIPVHLYGNMANMDEILPIAKKNGLYVIEDAAHKHGGEWNHLKAGTLGDIGSFSLQGSKILTAGEGGIIVTSDDNIAIKLDALRNCGRIPTNIIIDKTASQYYGEKGDLIQSGNYRITEFQAAVLLAQMENLEYQNNLREENAKYLDKLLDKIPGVEPMKDDPRETKKAYFNYVFRYQEDAIGVPVSAFRKALSAELGIEVNGCYQPLNNCSLYRPLTKKRYAISDKHLKEIDPSRFNLPICKRIYESESVRLAHRFLMGSKDDMDCIAQAVQKVIDHVPDLM